MVAAEVIKVIGRKEAPMNNVFLFDATAGLGEIHLHPSEPFRESLVPSKPTESAFAYIPRLLQRPLVWSGAMALP